MGVIGFTLQLILMHYEMDPVSSIKSKLYCGLHSLIIVPTNLLRLDAAG